MKRHADMILGVAAIASLIAAVVFARNEHYKRARVSAPALRRTITDGHRYADTGIIVGSREAPIRIVEFADFECKYCRQLHPVLTELLARHSKDVALVYRHFPLSPYGFAIPAALAAECAASQGRFEPYAASLFEAQADFPQLDFQSVALRTGVSDTARFRACRNDPNTMARVRVDADAGRELGITGTPTLVIGNLVLVGALPLDTLERLIAAEKARK